MLGKYLISNVLREGEGAAGAGAGAGAGGGDGAAAAAAAAAAGAKPWYDGKADAETIGHWDNKGWNKADPIDVAIQATKQAREAQKHFGVPPEQLLKLPKDASDEAGWKTVLNRIGVPSEAKDYDFSGVKYADGADLEAGFTDAMRAALHKAGVRKDSAPDVVRAVIKYLGDADTAETAERNAKIATEKAELEKSWGANKVMNKLAAIQGAKRLGISEEAITALEGQVGYAAVMEAMRKIGAATTEDTFVEGKGAGSGGNPATREGAVARQAELMSNKDWVKRYTEGGKAEINEWQALSRLIVGEAA